MVGFQYHTMVVGYASPIFLEQLFGSLGSVLEVVWRFSRRSGWEARLQLRDVSAVEAKIARYQCATV